ncbi:MAG: GntR family transcriptional regulator [Bacteroidaceae bacterium]
MIFKEPKAIYLQIADRICNDIITAYYLEESRIPSVREYAALVEVNANTVMRTYEYLQQLGAIYNKRGIGYFVASGAQALLVKQACEAFEMEDLPRLFEDMQRLDISLEKVAMKYKEFCANKPQKNKKDESHD